MVTRLLDIGCSWRWGYAFAGLLFLTLALSFGLTLKQWRLAGSVPQKAGSAPPTNVSNWDTLKIPALWLSLVLFFLFTGIEGVAAQWPYTLFTEARAIDPVVAGLWVSIFWATMNVGRLFFGVVVERVKVESLVRMNMAAIIFAVALIWWNVGDTVSFAALAIVGFALSPLFPVLTSNTPERLGGEHAPNAIGFQIAATRVGFAGIAALAGVLAVAFGLEVIGLYMFAVSLATLMLYEVMVRRS
jgi:fucose permease